MVSNVDLYKLVNLSAGASLSSWFRLVPIFSASVNVSGIFSDEEKTSDSRMSVDIETLCNSVGSTYPEQGWKVTCHFTLIDSSRDLGKPFEFTIGRGEVIASWDQGLAKISAREPSSLFHRTWALVL